MTKPSRSVAPIEGGDAIATAIPGAERETLVGQGHVADPDAVAARLLGFFRA